MRYLPQSCGRVGAWVTIHWHVGQQLDLAGNPSYSMYNKSMLTVIESPEFIDCATNVWSTNERHAFIDWISAHPEAGDVIAGSGGLRKVRWSRAGMGKRGGARVIYFVRNARGELVLVTVYTKGRIESLPAHLLRALMEKYRV
jgi:hypothetical protein